MRFGVKVKGFKGFGGATWVKVGSTWLGRGVAATWLYCLPSRRIQRCIHTNNSLAETWSYGLPSRRIQKFIHANNNLAATWLTC